MVKISALWFVMEPLMTKNDNFSFSFYKAIIDSMKNKKDKTAPEDEDVNRVRTSDPRNLRTCLTLFLSVVFRNCGRYATWR